MRSFSVRSSRIVAIPGIALLFACGTGEVSSSPSIAPAAFPDGARVMLPVGADAAAASAPRARPHVSTANDVIYQGGVGGIGVETTPKVYVVFWGSQWSTDPAGEAALLQKFYPALGGSVWNGIVTQYCQGVPAGTVSCNGAGQPAGNPKTPSVYGGAWFDNAAAAPASPTQANIANEAIRAATHFANTAAAKNASVQYVIATAHGNNQAGFGSTFCAYHSFVSSSAGNIAYTNLPYITDAGAGCGANFNNLPANAGITIVAGHEFAETESDQFPSGGWLDSGGSEIGDKCAWINFGQGKIQNVALSSTATFPMQSLWSNIPAGGEGGCVFSKATTTACTPNTSIPCCPATCNSGCTCPGVMTCNSAGTAYGTCSGETCAPLQCQ